jgi:hypothetical protein
MYTPVNSATPSSEKIEVPEGSFAPIKPTSMVQTNIGKHERAAITRPSEERSRTCMFE